MFQYLNILGAQMNFCTQLYVYRNDSSISSEMQSVLWRAWHLADLGPMFLLILFFPLLLCHHEGGHHGDENSEGDNKYSYHLGNAELSVETHRVTVYLIQIGAAEVVVVVQEQPLDITKLSKHSLQIAVALPRVSSEHDVCTVRIETQEGLELNGGEIVIGQVQ